MPLFAYALTLRCLLHHVFGLSVKPCNPYKDDYYTLSTNRAYFVGPMLDGGSSRVDIPEGDNPFVYEDKDGHACELSYSEGTATHKVFKPRKRGLFIHDGDPLINDMILNYPCERSCYDKAVFALKVTISDSDRNDGVFTFVGRRMSKNILHYNTTCDFLKGESNTLGSIWELNSDIEGVVMGKVSFFDNIFRIMATTCGLFAFLGIKEYRGFYIITIMLFVITITLSVLTMLINMFENNNDMKIYFYKYRITRYLKFIEYGRNILDPTKYCCETAGHPLECKSGDSYFTLEEWDSGFEAEFNRVKANKLHSAVGKNEEITRLKLNYCLGVSERLTGVINSCKFSLGNHDGFKTSEDGGGLSSLDEGGNIKTYLEFSSNSLFSNKIVRFEKLMSKKSYITVFKMLKEMSSLNKSAHKPKYFKKWNFAEEERVRHSSEIKEIVEELTLSPKMAIRREIGGGGCWVLGIGIRDLNEFEMEILDDHNKRFFGVKEGVEYISLIVRPSFFFTPKNMGCSQWKKYQCDLKYILDSFNIISLIKLDKRYKPSSWLKGFLEEKHIKTKVAFSTLNKNTSKKSPLVNDLIIDSAPDFVKALEGKLEDNIEGVGKSSNLEIIKPLTESGSFGCFFSKIDSFIEKGRLVLEERGRMVRMINENKNFEENYSYVLEENERLISQGRVTKSKKKLEIIESIKQKRIENKELSMSLENTEKIGKVNKLSSEFVFGMRGLKARTDYMVSANNEFMYNVLGRVKKVSPLGVACFDDCNEVAGQMVNLLSGWIKGVSKNIVKGELNRILEESAKRSPILGEIKSISNELGSELQEILDQGLDKIREDIDAIDKIKTFKTEDLALGYKELSKRFCLSNGFMEEFDMNWVSSHKRKKEGKGEKKKKKKEDKKGKKGKNNKNGGCYKIVNPPRRVRPLKKNKNLPNERDMVKILLMLVSFGNLYQSKKSLEVLLRDDKGDPTKLINRGCRIAIKRLLGKTNRGF